MQLKKAVAKEKSSSAARWDATRVRCKLVWAVGGIVRLLVALSTRDLVAERERSWQRVNERDWRGM